MPVIFDYDFGTELRKKLGGHKIFNKIEGWVVKVEINDHLLKLLKEHRDDQLITKIVQEKGQKICKETELRLEKQIVESLAEIKKSTNKVDEKAIRARWYKEIDGELKKTTVRLKLLPREQWNKLLLKVDERTKEYKKYKSDAIVDIVVTTGGLVVAAGAVGSAAASFGATAIPAIIATVRSSCQFVQAIRTLAEDVETVQERAQKHIKDFLHHYHEKRKSVRSSDVAKAVLNGVLGINVATSLQTLIKDVDLWSAKAGGLYVAAVKFSRLTTGVLAGLDKGNAELRSSQLAPELKSKMEKHLAKLEKDFTQNFNTANAFMGRSKEAMKGLKQAKEQIHLIEGDTPGSLQKMDKIASLLTGFTLAAAGATTGFIEAEKEALKIAAESLRCADDLGILLKEAIS